MSSYGNYHLVFVYLIVIVIGSSFGQSGPETCSPFEYVCSANGLCYNNSHICDRILDCPGGDDETDCERKEREDRVLTQTLTPLDPTTSTEVRQNSTVNSHRNISAEGTEQTALSILEPSTSEETSTEASPTVRTSPTRMARENISITPSVGPVSGGTEINITGPNVNVDVLSVFIAGRPCNIRDQEMKNRTICYTPRVDEPIESAITMVYKNGNLTSDRVFSYKPDPEIYAITPLKQFQMGGQKQTIRGENLNIIGRPVFVVTAVKNASSLEFNSSCKAENSTTMICRSPNISFSDQNNSNAVSGMNDMQSKEDRQNTTTRVKRDAEDDCIPITSSHVSGEYVEFTVGFYLDGVEKWRPQNISRYLDKKYTTYAVMEDPVINKFPGENNIYSIGEDTQYLVITGERLNCGAQKEDFRVEVGLDYCRPIISLHSRQLTCKPPGKKPPLKSDEDNYGHPHVRVWIGNIWHDIGYLRYVVLQPWMIALAVIAAVLVIVVVTLTVVYLLRRNSRHRRYKQSGVSVTEEGYMGLRPIETEAKESTKGKGKDTIFPTLTLELQLSVKDVIIESERLILRDDNILGRGCFGVVKSGSLQTTPSSECTPGYEGPRQEVAVKLLKHNADQDELVNFLEEGLMMKDLQHPNVLTLIGICIDDRGVPMIILPYMKFGNLKTFIQDKDRVFTVKDLIMLGHQVASGMCYLSEIHRMVHRDLAARNCMVDETKTVKVGDFGLSRDVYEKDYYVCKDNKAKLPAKWMAPECFIMQHYDTKTDVWAYGVLLWELMTRGQTPYPAIDNWDLVEYLQKGKRLQKPPYASDEVYYVMCACWRLDPDQRPDFKGIVEMLDNIIKPAVEESESDDYMTLIPSTYDYVYSHWQGPPK